MGLLAPEAVIIVLQSMPSFSSSVRRISIIFASNNICAGFLSTTSSISFISFIFAGIAVTTIALTLEMKVALSPRLESMIAFTAVITCSMASLSFATFTFSPSSEPDSNVSSISLMIWLSGRTSVIVSSVCSIPLGITRIILSSLEYAYP